MKPLSIEEIKNKKDEDWLYIVDLKNEEESSYYRFNRVESVFIIFHNQDDSFCPKCFLIDNYGKTWVAYKNKEQAECKGELVELPRIIHPNELEWFVQYQYPSGIINDEIFYSLEQAEEKLKELICKNFI